MMAASSCQISIQFTYALAFSLINPLFHDRFGLPEEAATAILGFIGPFIGFFIQPIFGAMGDRCTFKFGRRRIFIFCGCIVNMIGATLLCISTIIDNKLADEGKDPNHVTGVCFGIIGIFLSIFGLNIMQGPSRAIMSDLFDNEQQQTANLIINAFNGFASVICNIVTGVLTLYTISEMQKGGNINLDVKYVVMFGITTVLNIIFLLPTIIFAKEQRFIPEDGVKTSLVQPFIDLFQAIKMVNLDVFFIIMVEFFGWFAYNAFNAHLTSFLPNDIYVIEDKSDPMTDYGLVMGCFMFCVLYFFQMFAPFIFPVVSSILGEIFTFILAQGLAAVSYVMFILAYVFLKPERPYEQSNSAYLVWTIVMFISVIYPGLAFTQTNSLPFSMLKKAVPAERYGSFIGLLNCAVVLGQFVSSTLVMIIQGSMEPDAPETVSDSSFSSSSSETPSVDGKYVVSMSVSLAGAVICTLVSFVLFRVKQDEVTEAEKEKLVKENENEFNERSSLTTSAIN